MNKYTKSKQTIEMKQQPVFLAETFSVQKTRNSWEEFHTTYFDYIHFLPISSKTNILVLLVFKLVLFNENIFPKGLLTVSRNNFNITKAHTPGLSWIEI